MLGPLRDKKILLGVTGSIACYKAADLASKLTQQGALVDIVLTRSAQEFITPLTFHSVTHRPVVRELFDLASDRSLEHVALAERVDIVVVAPATANIIAKMATGLANDMLTAIVLATRVPVMVAPAMDGHMYDNAAVQANLETLRERGVHIAGPAVGRLASGQEGPGRMLEVPELLGHIRLVLGRAGNLRGKTIVVSAGGTQEPIDPVRVITNRSSGKMGYAIVEAARDRGARVVLVTAPTALPDPVGVEVVLIQTAQEMRDAVLGACQGADVLVMAAAVADYRPVSAAPQKVKKGTESWTMELARTADILQEAPAGVLKVGFAAESEWVVENAKEKLRAKGLDLVVANDVTAEGAGFAHDTNKVTLLSRDGAEKNLPLMAKYEVAHHLLDWVGSMLG